MPPSEVQVFGPLVPESTTSSSTEVGADAVAPTEIVSPLTPCGEQLASLIDRHEVAAVGAEKTRAGVLPTAGRSLPIVVPSPMLPSASLYPNESDGSAPV